MPERPAGEKGSRADFLIKLKADITRAEEAVATAREELIKAETAGVDVSKQRAEYEKAVETLRKIKAVYLGL